MVLLSLLWHWCVADGTVTWMKASVIYMLVVEVKLRAFEKLMVKRIYETAYFFIIIIDGCSGQ